MFTFRNHAGTFSQPKKPIFANHSPTSLPASSSTFTWDCLRLFAIYFGKLHNGFISCKVGSNFTRLFFSTFAWNFIDVYLIIISVLLTEKFACINRKLLDNRRNQLPTFWSEVWCGYKTCVELVDRTNELNGGTILISFFSNLYFICVQLLGCFKSESSILDGMYLWFSLTFLICRTLTLCLYASKINDESMKPLHTLRSIHSDYFDVTMHRFNEQLMGGKVALTGLNFFYLTRKLILSVSLQFQFHFTI